MTYGRSRLRHTKLKPLHSSFKEVVEVVRLRKPIAGKKRGSTYWWSLALHCGHVVERRITDKGPPKKIHCKTCVLLFDHG